MTGEYDCLNGCTDRIEVRDLRRISVVGFGWWLLHEENAVSGQVCSIWHNAVASRRRLVVLASGLGQCKVDISAVLFAVGNHRN